MFFHRRRSTAARRFPALHDRPWIELASYYAAMEGAPSGETLRRGLAPFASSDPFIYHLYSLFVGSKKGGENPTPLEVDIAERLVLLLAQTEAVPGRRIPRRVRNALHRWTRILEARQLEREPSPDYEDDDPEEDSDPEEIAAEEAEWRRGVPQRPADYPTAERAASDAYYAECDRRGVKRARDGVNVVEIDGRRVVNSKRVITSTGETRFWNPRLNITTEANVPVYSDTGEPVVLPVHRHVPDFWREVPVARHRYRELTMRDLRQRFPPRS